MRCVPRIISIVCSYLLYGFITGVAADIPQNHTTVPAVDDRIVYHPLLNLETDCAHVQCAGWWTQPGPKSGSLSPFSFIRSTTSTTAQFSIRFSGTSYVAIAGQKISGAQAIVTLTPGTQDVLTASATEGSLFELDNLYTGTTYSLQFVYRGPETISIAALYFDRGVAINPSPPAQIDTSLSVASATSHVPPRSSHSSKSLGHKATGSPSPSTQSAASALPNGPSPLEIGGDPSTVVQNSEPLTANSSEAPLPSAGTINPTFKGDASASGISNRGTLIGGCIAGALVLALLCFAFWFLRRRLVARRAASSDFIRARAIAAWNTNHWTVQPSSPALDTFSDCDQVSEARETQSSRVGRAI